jgi:NDP-sugar pyrophosphorylase family protein
MHRNFKFIRKNENNTLLLKTLREKQIFLIPILDDKNHIVDILNLKKYHNILPIDAVLMAGGKGERLRPLTEKIPKPLLPVGGKSIIDYNVDRLILYGINHISITVNYLGDQIEEHYKKTKEGIQINCIKEPRFLGTIGSITFIDHFYNDTLLVMNSELFTNINYEDFYLHFIEHKADMSVAAIPYSVSIPYGILELENKREIKDLIEKPSYMYYANAGIYLLKREIIKYIPKKSVFDATDLIKTLIMNQKKIIRFPLNGTWIDIGTPQEYKKANELVKHLL